MRYIRKSDKKSNICGCKKYDDLFKLPLDGLEGWGGEGGEFIKFRYFYTFPYTFIKVLIYEF